MTPPKSRLYKKEYAHELMRIANSDREAAKTIQSARAGRAENLAYFAEQITEKALMAVLCWQGVAFS